MNPIGLWFFLAAMAGDLIIPYLLAPLYKGYSHRRMVMSVLGSRSSPVRLLYSGWLVVGGMAFGFGSLTLYRFTSPDAPGISTAVLVLHLLFAVGAMVLSGIFPVGDTKAMDTLSARIHGLGSSFGFMALLAVPLLLCIHSAQQSQIATAVTGGISFGLALTAFVLFVLSDKPLAKGTFLDREGTWQRLTLLFCYLPTFLVCLQLILSSQKGPLA